MQVRWEFRAFCWLWLPTLFVRLWALAASLNRGYHRIRSSQRPPSEARTILGRLHGQLRHPLANRKCQWSTYLIFIYIVWEDGRLPPFTAHASRTKMTIHLSTYMHNTYTYISLGRTRCQCVHMNTCMYVWYLHIHIIHTCIHIHRHIHMYGIQFHICMYIRYRYHTVRYVCMYRYIRYVIYMSMYTH